MTDIRVFFDPEPAPQPGATPAADPNPTPTPSAKLNLTEHLPEDLRQDPNIVKFGGDPEQLARGYLNATKMLGRDVSRLVELPPADDDGKGRLAVLQRLGLPAAVENYEIKVGENTPPALKLDGELGKWFKATAHGAGILPDQAQKLYDGFAEQIAAAGKARDDAAAAQRAEQEAALKTEWGEAYSQRIAAAQYGMKQVGGDALVDAIMEAGLDANPTVLKAFAKIGMSVGSGNPVIPNDAGSPTPKFGDVQTPDELIARAREINKKAAAEKNQTERMRLAEEAQKLFERAAASKAA